MTVAKYWIKTGVIKHYDNLRLLNQPENLTSLNQATLVYAIHWPQSRGGLHNPECTVLITTLVISGDAETK